MDLDINNGEGAHLNSSPPGSAPVPVAAAALAPTESAGARVLDRLLRMADGYRAAGALRQAEELYFRLADDHPRSAEGQMARERLLELCEDYEHFGYPHQARALYERLLG